MTAPRLPRLAIVASHPVQYYAPLFRELAARMDLTVFYGHRDTAQDQARAGFGQGFAWDVDLTSGYRHVFLENRARQPGLGRFSGVDTPDVGRHLREGEFDAVLLMGWYLKCFAQALIAARRAGIPAMVRGDSQLGTPRSVFKKLAKELAYPPFLRQFSRALIVGSRNRSYWEHYRYPAERMIHSPHCVDGQWFAERATPAAREALRARIGVGPGVTLALFAGKLIDFKRPLDLIEGAAKARQEGHPIEVLVAGAGPLEAAMAQRALLRQVPLHRLGFCNQTEMPAAYAAADVLVLPSTGRETWGLVVNEAIAAGCPAIISQAAGCAPDMAAARGEQWLYPCGDTDALAGRLGKFRTFPDALAQTAAAFSMDAAARGIDYAVRSMAGLPPITEPNA